MLVIDERRERMAPPSGSSGRSGTMTTREAGTSNNVTTGWIKCNVKHAESSN
jgi:hypothetical protein